MKATRGELAAEGYDRLSIDRIAAAAGVGKQTIYRWYSSKSALIAECILRGDVLPLGFVVPQTQDCRADIAQWIDEFATESRSPLSAALTRAGVAAAAEHPEVAARYADVTRATESALIARLDLGVAAGQISDAMSTATMTEMILGALLYRVLNRQEITEQYSEQLLEPFFITAVRVSRD
ncbi:TetR/AcrR family transcriptional regulator [Herbiconiux ginsengi]|nr:TetR/AcrR family transcriptional regulator [Herbiconiux ginsengi]